MTPADVPAPGVVVDLLANLNGRLAAHIQANQFPAEPLEKRLLPAAGIAKNAPGNLGLHDLLDGQNPPVWMPRLGPRDLPKLPVQILPVRFRGLDHCRLALGFLLLGNLRVGLELEVIHTGQKISQPVRSAVWLRLGGIGGGRNLRNLCRRRRAAPRQIGRDPWRRLARKGVATDIVGIGAEYSLDLAALERAVTGLAGSWRSRRHQTCSAS